MSNILTPRDCQWPMIERMTLHDRGNVFASPGTGKTSATLLALDIRAMHGDRPFPALVVGPKRVANSVWDAEIERWARFKGIRLAKVLGPIAKRDKALKSKADVYVINYENLAWLHEQVGGKGKWPFRTVIADESTKLRSHRCSFRLAKNGATQLHIQDPDAAPSVRGGGLHARSLARNAPFTDAWFNLTGTPTPLGLQDFWGQMWPIDYGQSLGRTYTDFTRRWFRPAWGSNPHEQRIEILPHAEKEILAAVKEHSVMVDAYDYFDIEKPVELDRFVTLPPKVRKHYDEMHADSITELTMGATILAANQGSVVMKCRQMASGGVIDVDGDWHTMHTEKLDALQEIHESIHGAPLLVAYWFKHDLEQIKKRFKHAVELPKGEKAQRQVEDKWNAGKIPMLLVHPQSAGHGLSLQHGGNHMAIYSLDWNAEYYMQIIERIGPTRQAQSGYKRLTYVHRIIAKDTWEVIVAKNLQAKMSTDQMVKEALSMINKHEVEELW